MDTVFIHRNDSNTADRRSPRMAQLRRKQGSRIAATSLVLALALTVLSAQAQADLAFESYNRGDYATALREWRPLAEQGNPGAQVFLGIMYADGKGVPKDNRQAVAWYRKAAEQGFSAAQHDLGRMYTKGIGVPQDDDQAVFWYRKAAEQGEAEAQALLGGMYVIGRGVPEDDVQGYAWLNLAAAQGNDNAKAIRTEIRQRMTRDQIAEGQKLSRELAAQIANQGGTTP